jgi:hypothetical protein
MEQKVSIGTLIDSCIRFNYSKYSGDVKKFTKFIQQIATYSGLSVRQITRMREAEDFPSMKTVTELSPVVPEVSILDPQTIAQRILLGFSTIQREQDELKKELGEFKITVIAGWSIPQALIDDNIALALAKNINAGISYEFIYPSIYDHPSYLGDREIHNKEQAKDYLCEISSSLFMKIYKKVEDLDISDNGDITKRRNAIAKTKDKITFISTYSESLGENKGRKPILFWLSMPSKYVVFYNFGEKDKSDNIKSGSFLVTGKILRDNPDNQVFESRGWFHMGYQEYREIENIYNSLKESWTPIFIDKAVIDKASS